MPRSNYEQRQAFARALERVGGWRGREAVRAIEAVTAARPGLLPDGLSLDGAGEAGVKPLHDQLTKAANALPTNLTVRAALAEAKWRLGARDEARELFVSVIRDARPLDTLRAPEGSGAALRGEELRGQRFQSVDLGSDFVEGDPKDARVTARETLMAHWPDLRGKSVLDVGSYAGWFAFEAERRGAARVMANDFYSWMVNYPEMWAWVARELEAGRSADTYNAPSPALNRDALPGRALFDRTRALLGSRVEPLFGLIDDVPVEPHDVVLLLGVLYHHENPLQLLRRMFDLTRETLVVETLAVEHPRIPNVASWQCFGPGGWAGDATTTWAPTELGLVEALKKVGFREVEVLYGWDGIAPFGDVEWIHYRLWVHARK